MPAPAPADRIGVGLHPRTPEVEAIVARRIVEFAAEVGDVEILEAVADEVEEPTSTVSAADLMDRAGISYRQMHTWTTAGYLTPEPREGNAGSGRPLRYGTEAVLKARIMGSLVTNLDMRPGAASTTADEILSTGRAQVGPFVVTKRGALS